MPSSVNSPEDVVNIALARLGYKGRVSSLYDGSPAAKKALDVYSQTRDATLRARAWGFAERIIRLAPTGGAATYPWSVEYAYPADCIKVRSIYSPAFIADANNPLPTLWTVANAGAGKVIWAKFTDALMVYTAQVTNPALWEDPDFVESLVAMLAKQLAPVMADANMAALAAKEAVASIQAAEDGAE